MSTHAIINTPSNGYTYAELKASGLQSLASQGMGERQRGSFQTALNSWVRCLGLRYETQIGQEMSSSFDRSWTRVMDELQSENLAKRTIQDRCELMVRWQRMYEAMLRDDHLPESFSGALATCMSRAGLSTGELARRSGLWFQRIRDWETGKHQPTPGGISAVKAIERELELKPGTLTSRLPRAMTIQASLMAMAQEGTTTMTTYGKRMQRLGKERLGFTRQPDGRLLEQWRDLIAYKSDYLRDGVRGNDVWRLKKLRESGVRLKPSNVWNGMVCTAADACWNFLGGYLGWLSLSKASGGAGIPVERVDSLAWILQKEKVFEYFNWRMRRAGVVHKGMLQVLVICCMLLRPQTGWVWLHPELADTVDEDYPLPGFNSLQGEERVLAWRRTCAQAYESFAGRIDKLEKTNAVKPSRDKWEAIRDIVSSKRPLQALAGMISELERMEPPVSARAERAVWTRDVLLLKMLASNPLRIQQFSIMTYSRDADSRIYRKPSGGWALRFKASDFKNERFAAQEPYNADIPESLWRDIDRYLSEGRPYLAVADSEYFFLRSACGLKNSDDAHHGFSREERYGMWRTEGMEARVRRITAALRPGSPGFGPHSFRYICASDFLKRHPGAYSLVATLLHDKLSTVLDTYAHLQVQDGLDRHFDAFTAELAQARGHNVPEAVRMVAG